jgi:hypothetical protein
MNERGLASRDTASDNAATSPFERSAWPWSWRPSRPSQLGFVIRKKSQCPQSGPTSAGHLRRSAESVVGMHVVMADDRTVQTIALRIGSLVHYR